MLDQAVRPARRTVVGGLLSLTAVSCAPKPAGTAELVVLAGQSNALGFNLGPEDLPPDHLAAELRVRIWAGQAFEPLQPGANTGAPGSRGSWGPEVAFARRWIADHPAGTLYIVKHARGSTPLHPHSTLDWAPSSEELFLEVELALTAAKAALATKGLAPRVTTILWMQGETDAYDRAAADDYSRGLEAFIIQARRRWGDPSTRIVIGQTSSHRPLGATIRTAQARAAESLPGVILVDTDSYPLQVDDLHLSAAGQLRLGAEMYAASRAAGGSS